MPGCAEINEGVLKRLAGAELLFFDGTTFTDGEMVDLGLSKKTAWRMGHVAMSGEKGSLARLCPLRDSAAKFMFISTIRTRF